MSTTCCVVSRMLSTAPMSTPSRPKARRPCGASARFSIAAAKSQASEFAHRIAAISHQCMGVMGFTHEHILHHYTRRLWVWRRDFGSETFWGEKIGTAYAAAGPKALWTLMTASRYAA